MSANTWQSIVQTAIRQPGQAAKIAVVGIGHELRGDDAAGIEIVRALTEHANRLVIEAGTAPENHTGALRRFLPDLVVMIDAALMNLEPGAIRALDSSAADGFGASTHTLPLGLLSQYLAAELGCAVLLIGIQPADTTFGAPLSPAVQRACAEVSRALQSMLDGSLEA